MFFLLVSLSLLWSSLSLIWLRDAWKSHDGRRAQLCGANFVLKEGERLHLAGDNGCGKSSLLKILAGVDRLDKGELIIKKGLRIWLVAQEALEDVEGSITVRETLLNGEGTAFVAAREYETALGLLKEDGESPNILRRYERALEAAEREDAWALEARLNTAVQKLGISHLMHRPVSALSGGEKKRTALAAAIAADADVLLLDEPTNHLDIWATRWLEQYLLREATNTAVIFISHDRRFAVQVAQGVLELDNGYLYRHEKQDNINDDLVEIYLRNKAKRLLDDETASQTARVKLKRELAWLRQGAKARQTKAKHRIQNVQILKNEAQSNQRFQVKDLSPTNSKENKNTQKKQTKTALLEIDDLYAHDCFEQFCFELGRGDRHAIIGSNGSGKSSLAAAIHFKIMAAYFDEVGDLELRERFDAYCRFGKTTDAHSGLTNKNLFKLMREASLIDRSLSSTTLDLIFVRIAQRGAKKITFFEFLQVLQQCADIKNISFIEIRNAIIQANGPKLNSISPAKHLHLDVHTGSHKTTERNILQNHSIRSSVDKLFLDQSEARELPPRRKDTYCNYQDLLIAYFTKYNPSKIVNVPNLLRSYQGREHELFLKIEKKYGHPIQHTTSLSTQSSPSSARRENIYDKLTDISLYTGVHKHRFDPSTGKGRGLQGRDSIPKGGGPISQIPISSDFDGNTNGAKTECNFSDSSQFLMRCS